MIDFRKKMDKVMAFVDNWLSCYFMLYMYKLCLDCHSIQYGFLSECLRIFFYRASIVSDTGDAVWSSKCGFHSIGVLVHQGVSVPQGKIWTS